MNLDFDIFWWNFASFFFGKVWFTNHRFIFFPPNENDEDEADAGGSDKKDKKGKKDKKDKKGKKDKKEKKDKDKKKDKGGEEEAEGWVVTPSEFLSDLKDWVQTLMNCILVFPNTVVTPNKGIEGFENKGQKGKIPLFRVPLFDCSMKKYK